MPPCRRTRRRLPRRSLAKAALDELRRELKQPDAKLEAFDALTDQQVALLTRGLTEARTRQRHALHRAVEDSLGFIPALLRVPIQKIIFRK